MIFVGGCERSGTSLVQKILASHSRIAGGPELVFTGRVAELYRQMAARYPPEYAARIAAFYDPGELAEAFRGLFNRLLRKVGARKPGARYLSEKTPSNIFAAARLLEIFPDGRFVHVIRDGRDVLASHRDVRRRLERGGRKSWNRASFRLHRVCARWNRAAEIHFELAGDSRLAERYLAIRYEDLVRGPRTAIAGLFDFLELDVEPNTISPETATVEEQGFPIDGIWTTGDRRGFDPETIGRWQRSLPLTSRVLGSLFLGKSLERLDYPVASAYARTSRALWRLKRLGGLSLDSHDSWS